jgi:hypothetical protein
VRRRIAERVHPPEDEEVPVTERVEFEVHTESPTAEHYRHDWVPAPGVALGGIWGPAVVSAADGSWYFGLRGWSDFIYGTTHTVSPVCGFQALRPGLGATPTHLFPEYAGLDWMEPYIETVGDGASTLVYDSGQVERRRCGTTWSDATGRWLIDGASQSDIFLVHVPVQDGVPQEVYYRHELLKATGTVDGKAVEGYLHQDFAYGPPGTTYTDLAIARDLYGMWVSWIHEYDDGTHGGGCFWQGRGGIEFGPGYLLEAGTTTAHADITTTVELDDAAQLTQLEVEIGGESFGMDFTMAGSPIHFFGEVTRSSTPGEIVRSWCWAEHPGGMINGDILDIVNQKYSLARRGQP